ncbi:heavy metal translocating P-type ATPase [Miltoncostaea marina]|uniref:heavy metal translocating P-type ATPase n=1 Tax=Miltoncostaea marina TaxID=2843215 RepID=UPI001C3D5727|nr:cation-translocating P-type ATPase [Miltoncostaea marina]
MSDDDDDKTPTGPMGWREAVYRFPPLRNAAIAALLTIAGVVIEWRVDSQAIALPLFIAAIVIGGYFFAREGVEEFIEEREIGIEALMLAAAAGAMAFGLFEEAAALVVLYASAEAVEELTFARTRSAIRDLLELAPRQARVLRDGREETIPAEDLRPGDVFVVRPGESLPTDGVIRSGRTTLNEAPVTGEAVPVDKGPGADVFAGTVNGPSAIEVEATRAFADNSLSRIVHLVEEAQAQKSRAQRFVDRFSDRYSPAVLGAALLVAVVPPLLGGDWSEWALRGVTLLVAGAPCALVMSVPVAVAAAISRAGRSGILIKGGAQLETLGRLQAVCFDKTGTLTRGHPQVTDFVTLDGASREEALRVAAAVEARSEHPLARAILAYVRGEGIDPPAVEDFEAVVGHGATARLNGDEVWVGSPRLLARLAPQAAPPAEVERLEQEGKTVVLVGAASEAVAVVAMRDEPRPEAREALGALRRLGLTNLVMLTGDNRRTAEAIARGLGIDDVRAELLPEQKVDEIERVRAAYGTVAMVGDGINDAPALARADLGIALGTGATDAAIEAADIALMADDLKKLPEALAIGRRSQRISRQNLVFSIALLTLLIPSAVVGLLTVVVAVLVHEVSELLAVANGLRAARSPDAVTPAASPA